MNIVFFEVQAWEKEILKATFPEAILVEDKLDVLSASAYKSAVIASTFINSSAQKQVIDLLPNLKFISTRSTGYDHIDVEYCKTKNIVVSNVPEYGSNTVAEHTIALLLSLTRKIYQSVNQSKNLNFQHDSLRGVDLCGKTIGIIGLGKIGINVLRITQGLGMKALVVNHSHDAELQKQFNFQYVELDQLISASDVVTIHLPLNDDTHHIINKENIVKFKKGSFLINTARGGLIDTEAIMLALEKGILAGVGLDVLEAEKELNEEVAILTTQFKQSADLKNLVFNHILINHPHVLITPHNAFNSQEALERITQTTIENIHGFIASKAINTV